MTKIRIETRQPAPFKRSEVRPWLRYVAIVVLAGVVVWAMVSPEAVYRLETTLRAARQFVGL